MSEINYTINTMEINSAPVIAPQQVSIKLPLTAAEAEELAQLLNIAVKARGFEVAATAVKYLQRINGELSSAIVPANIIPVRG